MFWHIHENMWFTLFCFDNTCSIMTNMQCWQFKKQQPHGLVGACAAAAVSPRWHQESMPLNSNSKSRQEVKGGVCQRRGKGEQGSHWWDERGDVSQTKDEYLVLSNNNRVIINNVPCRLIHIMMRLLKRLISLTGVKVLHTGDTRFAICISKLPRLVSTSTDAQRLRRWNWPHWSSFVSWFCPKKRAEPELSALLNG